jgi:hypothetical protein
MEKISIAKTKKEIAEAKELVYRSYEKMGYVSQIEELESISKYLDQPQSITLVASSKNGLLGTISLVQNTSEGLPIDQIFKNEVDQIRQNGANLAEACQLAVKKDLPLKLTAGLTMQLLSHLIFTADYSKLDKIVFAVNPKHTKFYKILGCKLIGKEKVYPSVNGAPAQALELDMKNLPTKSNVFSRDILFKKPSDEFVTSLAHFLR